MIGFPMTHDALIEFIGLPGSGKTTLAAAVGRIFRSAGLHTEGPFGGPTSDGTLLTHHRLRVWNAIGLTATDPRFAFRSCEAITGTCQETMADLISVTVNWLFKTALTRKAERRSGVSILDEGFLHAAWSVNFSARRRHLPESLLSRVRTVFADRYWIVVDVDTPSRLALSRVVERDGTAHRMVASAIDRGEDRVMQRADSALASIRTALAGWPMSGPSLRVLRVKGDGSSTEGTARSIAEQALTAMGCD